MYVANPGDVEKSDNENPELSTEQLQEQVNQPASELTINMQTLMHTHTCACTVLLLTKL